LELEVQRKQLKLPDREGSQFCPPKHQSSLGDQEPAYIQENFQIKFH
jgi:hypothetical protein